MPEFRRSTFFPNKATLTEENLPDQRGKVFIVTGGNSGIGKELVKILYQHNARVYIATRSKERADEAIADIKASYPRSQGQLLFLRLVLDDLSTIKEAANQFLSQETRLDVLWNNAGVMLPPEGSKTVQGYELQLGVNSIAHFLFVKLLTPLILETAKTTARNTVRVVWVSSMSADFVPNPCVNFENMDYHIPEDNMTKYNRSKSGNLMHAAEFQRRYPDSGVVSVSLNPGLLKTPIGKNFGSAQKLSVMLFGHHPKFGAYTELFAGLDPSIGPNDKWVTPFGKKEPARADIVDPGLNRKYWEWCEEQVKPFL
ncbi:retinol dehydrogenase [Stachybotrys elegans]|uniref:Retinol dehydrogenase n=1 Tax=Stachybotrys elegans TaxID=80388 RepID=A0A8K0WM19_9HYPO|nr:retinol dehydrogenase [Stachybotrys elegans]